MTTELVPSAHGSDGPFSFAELACAYFDARRHKRNTLTALAFEQRLEANLVELEGELLGGTYQPRSSICFVVTRPKPREVWAANFRDRVVHHLLYNRIAPVFEAGFIADSCACIKGRGTLYAAKRLESKVRSITRNWSARAFYLKCDLANFFVAIDKRILAELLAGRIQNLWWRELALQTLFHDPRPGAEIRSTPERLALIPRHKSLWEQPAHLGLPIGNLSSQFFANVYLDVLDQHVKHRLRARRYVRYVDDFILLHEDPQQLEAWRREIEAMLPAALRLRLNHSKTVLQPLERGVDFVGQVIAPWRRTVRRRTFNDAIARVAALPASEIEVSATSYFGLFRQASHGFHDQAALANLVRRRGLAVDRQFTKAFN